MRWIQDQDAELVLGESGMKWAEIMAPAHLIDSAKSARYNPRLGELSQEKVERLARCIDLKRPFKRIVLPAVARAVNFFVRARQSRAGTFKGFTSLTRSRTRRGINGNASEWLGAVEGLPAVHARLQPVVIECVDALKLIPREDARDTLYYLDPPYLPETRATADAYAHEMTAGQHEELLRVLAGLKGKFLLSGYRSELYDRVAENCGWKRRDFDMPNHAAGGDSKRRMTECVWFNF